MGECIVLLSRAYPHVSSFRLICIFSDIEQV